MIALLLLLTAIDSDQECDDRQGDLGASQCWYAVDQILDAELNRLWPDLMRQAREVDRRFRSTSRRDKPSNSADLLRSQRVWLKFRDAQCALESDYADGGSLQNVIYGRCYAEMTRSRIKQLQDVANGLTER